MALSPLKRLWKKFYGLKEGGEREEERGRERERERGRERERERQEGKGTKGEPTR